MRVVLDTVVLVRGVINPSSWCGRLLFERRGRFQPIVSPSIVTEYFGVLQRPGIVAKYGIPRSHVLQFVLGLVDVAVTVDPPLIAPVCRDPNDDKFLAAALAGKADYIISEDLDLLDLKQYESIRILSAAAFLENLDRSNG